MTLKASSRLSESDRTRMESLKAEYSRLTTPPSRMREIYTEMTKLRWKVGH